MIASPDSPGFRRSRPWQVSYLSINETENIYKFLASTGRIDLPRASYATPEPKLDVALAFPGFSPERA